MKAEKNSGYYLTISSLKYGRNSDSKWGKNLDNQGILNEWGLFL